MPLGTGWINPNLFAQPTVRKAKVTDGATGRVLQNDGSFLPREAPGPVMNVGGARIGAGGGFSGGGGFSRYSGEKRWPILSIRDGSTLAPRATGAAPYHGLDAFDQNQRNLEADRFSPVMRTTQNAGSGKAAPPSRIDPNSGMAMSGPVEVGPTVASRADGGPLAAGQASIVGERGPELIVPQTDVKVVPTEMLPELPRNLVPALNAHATEPTRVAYDASGNVVGFGSGGETATGLLGLAPGRMEFARPRPLVPDERALALERERNPEGIVVGVTPRAPLVRDDGPRISPEERQRLRLERTVMREARHDPRLAQAVLDRQDAAAAGQAAAQGRVMMERYKQDQLNQRTQAGIEATNARAEATLKDKVAARDATAQGKMEDRQTRLMNNARIATNLQMQGRLPADQAMNIMTMTDPDAQDLLLKQAAYNLKAEPQAAQPVPRGPIMQPGAGTVLRNDAEGPRPMDPRDFEMVPVEGDAVTGKPTRYEWMSKRKTDGAKAPTTKNFGDKDNPDWREWDAASGTWKKSKLDGAGESAASAPRKPSGSFLGAVGAAAH